MNVTLHTKTNNKMKISYHKRFDSNGTVYDQAIRITKEQFKHLELALHSELSLNLPRKKEYVYTSGYELYLKPLRLFNDKVCFLNHTQVRFINLFLKLSLKDRNTCLLF